MSLVQMVIRSIVVGAGPMPSLVVLQPKDADENTTTLPIQIGSFEATAISMGIEPSGGVRPITHDFLVSLINKLDAKLKEVRIVEVHGTTFFAQVVVEDAQGITHCLDARPSDAIAFAVRVKAPIYAEQDVLQTASLPNFGAIEQDKREEELASFHSFVEELSPEDFKQE